MKREILSMNRGWRFHRGDVSYAKYMGHDALYLATKCTDSKGAGRRDFNDSDWRWVDLPHDYIVEGTPIPTEPGSHGSLPRENAWYRKTFKLDTEDMGKRIAIHFEGVCSTCVVHVNGMLVMRNFTAGLGFDVDITDIARYGEDVNVVSVYVDNHDFEGWYYEGGGIYRNVWLVKSGKVFVDLWGTYVTSQPAEQGAWNTQIKTEVKNIYDEDKNITLLSEIVDPDGNVVATVSSDLVMPARRLRTVEQAVKVDDVKVWDLDTPNIYQLRTTILSDGVIEDTYETTYGYRTIEYTVNDGFLLNGKRVFIIGYGSHQDLTGFGVGITDSINEHRMRRFQSMGFNLFRTAHNPFAPAMYDTCDRIGLMCMDENRWFHSTPEAVDEVIRMIKRDRNHPCIIMWSLFNEEHYRTNYIGSNIYRSLAAVAHEYDHTRPATGGDNVATAIPGAMDDIELIGINHVYNISELDAVRTNNPEKPIYFSEERLSDEIREYVRTHPYIFGAIGWGGLPYRGETTYPQLFNGRPREVNQIFNLLCDPTDMFYRNKALWTEYPTVKLTSHWTHPGKEGEIIPVLVYSNREYAELFLNGKSLGKKKVDQMCVSVTWDVPYEPGELKVVATTEGEEPITDTLRTVGKAAALALRIENPGVRKNGRDTAIITAYLTDSEGNELPEAEELMVKFAVKQGGKLLCVGSPNKWDHDSWKLPQVRLFENKAQVYVECSADTDLLEVEAVCEGYASASIVIEKAAGEVIPDVPVEDCRFLQNWYISPPLVDQPMPDIDALHASPNFEGWKYFEVGRGSSDSFAGIQPRKKPAEGEPALEPMRLIFHTVSIVPQSSSEHQKLLLHFEQIDGVGKVIFYTKDRRIEVAKDDPSFKPYSVDATGLTSGEEVEVWVVLEAENPFLGIVRPVRWVFE